MPEPSPDRRQPAHGAGRRRRGLLPSRIGRPSVTALIALAGLALLAFGPAGLALGWHEVQERRASSDTVQHPLGSEVREGPATFVVHEVRCGADEDGTRNGVRCEVTVGARNDGAGDLTIHGSAQVLHNEQGVRHLPVNADPAPFGTLEPGEDAIAVFEYDIPPHVDITHVGVHADPYSDGQAVSLDGEPLPLLAD